MTSKEESFDSIQTVIAAFERNSGAILAGSSSLVMASFALSSIIRFVKLGRSVQTLRKTKQNEMVAAVRNIVTPSAPLAPDPALQLSRDVTTSLYLLEESVGV